MKPGDVLLANLPQADGFTKDRPVLCLCSVPPFQDFLVCGISTQLTNGIESLDEIIAADDEDFRMTGLKAASLVRTAFLALLPQSRFKGRIGFVSESRRKRLLNSLANFLRAEAG
jgi:mRNA interferase MazF